MADDDVKNRIPSTRMCMSGDFGRMRAESATAGPPFFSDKDSTSQVIAPQAAVSAANASIAQHPEKFTKDASGRIGVDVSDTGDGKKSGARVGDYPQACPASNQLICSKLQVSFTWKFRVTNCLG